MGISAGVWVILGLALVSSGWILAHPRGAPSGMQLWTYARTHTLNYAPIVADWNRRQADPDRRIELSLIGPGPLRHRLMSGFMSRTPTADLIEIERSMAGEFFAGPVEAVGFLDLTDRIRAAGIDEAINAPSFSPWTSRGRIFGLPHDVHPVLLGYRADIVEDAGIDVSRIETWADFARVLGPLIRDLDGDGRPDRYLLNYWYTNKDTTEVLLLQAGGGYFDEAGHVIVDSPVNARVLATLVTWVCGPGRIALDAPEFTASGNQLRLQGNVVCSLMPDWLCGVWRNDLPGLAGKIKIMPLPAWEPGGRRVSVWGGTMLGIARDSPHIETAWEFAQELYLSADMAESLYRTAGIVSPVRRLWSLPCYDEPQPYFCRQAPGRTYLAHAPYVPRRTSSPFNEMAKEHLQEALIELRGYALDHGVNTEAELLPEAQRLLARAAQNVRRTVARNVFHREDQP